MTTEIFISLKPQFAELIRERRKTYEFRKYKPTRHVNRIWIYVTSPTAALRYIAEVGEPVEYPNKIPENGVGNVEFNAGLKKSKFAFPILHLDELNEPITYKELRGRFNFTPPQSFTYADRYPSVAQHVRRTGLRRLY